MDWVYSFGRIWVFCYILMGQCLKPCAGSCISAYGYKKMDGSSFVGITPPENWANIVYFSEAPRATYKEIREARPAQAMSRKAMMDFIEACKLKNCVVQEGYIRSLGMK